MSKKSPAAGGALLFLEALKADLGCGAFVVSIFLYLVYETPQGVPERGKKSLNQIEIKEKQNLVALGVKSITGFISIRAF
jgi:hypothetical protein